MFTEDICGDRHWLQVSHVFISTDLYHKPVLDTIVHLSDEESKAQNIQEDSQRQNELHVWSVGLYPAHSP